jgi:ribosomal protein S18 acetylase RimI-like enzyme
MTNSPAIVDLRQMTSRQLAPLLQEEAQRWREELHWDYRGSLELIKKFVDARSLNGCAALENGEPAGYGFYVLEEHKGLMGGMYVSPRFPQLALSRALLAEMTTTLRGIPRIERIEAQLMPFGCSFDSILSAEGFRLFPRQFMILRLDGAAPAESAADTIVTHGFELETWSERFFEPSTRLIHLAYATHVDGEINDQYRSDGGAHKFLKNIVILPGCGYFQPSASFVLREPGGDRLLGVVLTSEVSPGVGHTTQICVLPGYQGHGLGRALMQASIRALRGRRFSALSLTVTSANTKAVKLYESLGFKTIKTFAAGVRQG